MGFFISPTIGYYEGDRISADDVEVPPRPSADHTWDGQAWQPDAAALKTAHNAPILAQITALDVFIPRGLEDTWTALGFDLTKLPQIQQDRLTQKRALRAQLVG